MTDRVIHPTDYPIPHPPLVAFIRANGLDEKSISAEFPITIEGGQITATEFVREPDADGVPRRVYLPGDVELLKRPVTVPLISPPEAHGL